MPTYILKLRDRYCEWSTIEDAPVSRLMPLDEFRRYYEVEYGPGDLTDMLRRVEALGTSAMHPTTAEDLIAGNRAGPLEAELTPDEIWQKFARGEDENV